MTLTAHTLTGTPAELLAGVQLYQVDIDARAEIVGCRPAEPGPGIAVLAAGPNDPTARQTPHTFAVGHSIDLGNLPGWIPAGVGRVGDQDVVELAVDYAWRPTS